MVLSSIGFLIVLTVISISQEFSLFQTILTDSVIAFEDRAALFTYMYPFVTDTNPFIYDILLVAVSMLVGLNISLVTRLYQNSAISRDGSVVSAVGTGLAAVSVGCVTCGAAALAGILSAVGGASIVLLLPYDGLEFLVISVCLLFIATYANSLAVVSKNACSLNTEN